MKPARTALWSVCIFLGLTTRAFAAAERVDLKRAVQIAADSSPDFNTLKRQLDIAVLSEKTAEARLWPTLDFSATHGLQDTAPRTGVAPWASQFNFALKETIYDNGVTLTQRRIAQLQREQADVVFKDQRNSLSLDVAGKFLTYSLNVKLLEIQEKQYERVKHQYEMVSRDYYQGIKTRKDFLRFKSDVNRAELTLLAARNAVETTRLDLIRVLGVGLKPDVAIDFVPFSFETVPTQLPDRLPPLTEHLQYRSISLQKEVAGLNADLVVRHQWPEWNISSGVSYGSQNYIGTGQSISDNAAWNWNALVTVTYNFLDWGIRNRDAEVAMQQKYVTTNQLDSSLLSLQAQLKQFEASVGKIQKSFGYAKELLELEKVNFDYIEREYRNGKVQYLDLITGLSSLTSAQQGFYSAANDLATARFQALYHQGKLYEELVR